MAIISNRLESIVREMTNTILRTGRSSVLTMARDFSCAIVTAEDELLATAEGLPVHVVGAAYQAKSVREAHPDFREGDAYLHNDPYSGNTHAADHTILVQVFSDDVHMFTVCAKAHQADAGNSIPTTYMPFARDVYEEGALIFPGVLIQRDYHDVEDIIRMCRRRIRVPDQWYGDYLAMLGAARIGERRLKELVETYGRETIQEFIQRWFDYSEQRTMAAIRELPAASFSLEGRHDPLPTVPDGIPIRVDISVDPEAARIVVDLRNNIDCVPAGVNESMVCAINNATTGTFNCLDPSIPHNAGSFRRVDVLLRENCVVGIPRFPTSCSLATTNVGDRLVSITQRAFAQRFPGRGLAEGAGGLGPGFGVIFGKDPRKDGEFYVNQIFLGSQGGPGTPTVDGWLVFSNPAAAGLLYRDSVEMDELRYPIRVDEIRIIADSEGAGRYRGAPGAEAVFGPSHESMTLSYTIDHHHHPPLGVAGGLPGGATSAHRLDATGQRLELPLMGSVTLEPGERVVSTHSGGGGYGPPWERDPRLVRRDVLSKWVSLQRADEVYGVVFTSDALDDSLEVDLEQTRTRRARLERENGGANGTPAG
jgi:N-methylhydantoinase B